MNNEIKFRNNGAIGALLDEYEKSINDLIAIIHDVSQEQLTRIVDYTTTDEDCKSIQTILTHVVESGFTYAVEIRKWLGKKSEYKNKMKLLSIREYELALREMFEFNVNLFSDFPRLKLIEYEENKKINVRWGQSYDVEQLIEHAIVHILRHRRQIEKYKEIIKNTNAENPSQNHN